MQSERILLGIIYNQTIVKLSDEIYEYEALHI